MEKNKIIDILKDNNIRITDNRVNILNCLADEKHFHEVSEILEHMGEANTKSVYNNIKVLVAKGIVDTHSFGGITKYAINDHFIENHNSIHIFDKSENVTHIDVDPKIMKLIKKDVEKQGHKVSSINISVNIKK